MVFSAVTTLTLGLVTEFWMLFPLSVVIGLAWVIIDNYNPNLLWYAGAVLCVISALAYYGLHLRVGDQKRFAPAPMDEDAVPAD